MAVKANQLLGPSALRRWTRARPYQNLWCVAFEYLCLAALHGTGISLFVWMRGSGVSDWWMLPLGTAVFVLTGILIHRIGLMGHEASHHLLHRDRFWNDVLANLLCFFPLWSSLSSYRAKHSGHHLHPNDPDHDPNLAGDKAAELYARFPMPRPSFIFHYYLKFFWPPFVIRNLLDLVKVLSVGTVPLAERRPWHRSPVVHGILSLVLLVLVIHSAEFFFDGWLPLLIPLGWHLLVLGAMTFLPDSYFRTGSAKGLAYSAKAGAMFRLSFHSATFILLSWLRQSTGFPVSAYYLLFWAVPLAYVFPYLMLLREIYQHANLGRGKLDNSRIIHADPFTRWAVLGYGNDYHLIHHIYPNIPHYYLREAHAELMDTSPVYREQFIETVGTFRAPDGKQSLLDSLASSRGPGPAA